MNTGNYVNVYCDLCAMQHRQIPEELPPSSAGKTLEALGRDKRKIPP